MQNPWQVPGRLTGLKPPSFAAGEPLLPPPIPPDPPDSSSSLSPQHFPPLSSPPSAPISTGPSTVRKGSKYALSTTDVTMAPVDSLNSALPQFGTISSIPKEGLENQTGPIPESEKVTVPHSGSEPNISETLKTIPPKNSPIFTNKASSHPTSPLASTTSELNPIEHVSSSPPPLATSSAPLPKPSSQPPPSGRPRVLIPDSVFQKGADIHKDFIICYFNGKAPPFSQTQSVFNHLWGKGKRLEIHNNPVNRTVLVRIQSDYLRQKILEKNIWYVGDSMFHTALWSSVHSKNTPPLKAIKIWAHLTGVPLDLRYKEGLSLVAGLVGDPKETDDFTLNLVSLTLAHVKVEVDLTKPLPSVVEFESQSGEVVEVSVHYPWGKKNPEPVKHNKKYQSVAKPKQGTYVKKYQLPSKAAAQNPVPMGSESPNINLINNFASLASNEGTPQIVMSSGRFAGSQLLSLPPSSNPFLSPDPPPRPSLKRSRSSPTLSPPLTSQPTPFHQFKTPSKTSQNPLFPFTNSPSFDVLNPRPFNQTLSLTLPPPLPSAPDPTTTSSYVFPVSPILSGEQINIS
ncbi:hypothetical protein DY000_02054939 [Brassica cretica]|uniref:DUF4283 domain-containing protein n=1 Tax=Brassica cretica TaxID=69181 RepID=A0ABQ7AJX6_BRACR|nr:hypothetical protein DY000_02054939 [Brassica cretica]